MTTREYEFGEKNLERERERERDQNKLNLKNNFLIIFFTNNKYNITKN